MKARNSFSVSKHPSHGLLLAACALSTILALPASAADDKSSVSPRADELLKRMSDYLGQAPFFSVSAEVWQDIQLSTSQRIQAGRSIELQVRRPNRFHAEIRTPRRSRELWYDGDAITLLNRSQNFYGAARASGSLDQAMDTASDKFGIAIPLEDLVRSDPRKDLLQRATSGADIGAVTVLGVPCEHLAFTQSNIDWQIWIEDGARPVPRKFVITYKDEPDTPQFTAIFTKWDFETKLPDFVFKFEPPAGATKIKVKEMKAENQPQMKEDK